MAYMDILPDPTRKILPSGQRNDTTGSAGPGFVSVKLSSNMPSTLSRTNGGRVVLRSLATHSWNIDITYNQLTRSEFEPVNAFLMARQGLLLPFYVILPQYELPRNSTFAAVAASTPPVVTNSVSSGTTKFLVTLSSASGNPSPGDIFNVVDTNNSNHVKTYMVTRCETNSDFDASSTQPTINQRILHITPPMVYSVASASTLKFAAPMFRVVPRGEVQEYSLGVNNTYQFNLNLEEALP
jgi:hypothetical protein